MEGIVLVIDDNLFYGQFIAHILSRNTPYHILHIKAGKSALNIAKSIMPILFLLDHRLPDMNGIELYDQLHEIEGHAMVPAIMLSADLPDQKLEEQLARRKIIGMKKPCQVSVLLMTIEMLLDSHQRPDILNTLQKNQ